MITLVWNGNTLRKAWCDERITSEDFLYASGSIEPRYPVPAIQLDVCIQPYDVFIMSGDYVVTGWHKGE